jgi:hypothetical protein
LYYCRLGKPGGKTGSDSVPEQFDIAKDERGRLVLSRPGQEDVMGVRIRRAFPWSRPGRSISIRNGEGKELLLIEDLESLPQGTRQAIVDALADTSFIPRITRIELIDTTFEHQEWRVQTDRGPAFFRVQEREDVRFLGDGRFRVKDADGNVYELPRLEKLDEHSRGQVEKLV